MNVRFLNNIIQKEKSKNLLITPNAIGDIILSSEFIREADKESWDIIVCADFYNWVDIYLSKPRSKNFKTHINTEINFNIVIDMCGQEETLLKLNKIKSVNCLIGFYQNDIYDLIIDFSKEVQNSSVFNFYSNLQKRIFGKLPKTFYPSYSKYFTEKTKIDLLIYPFSGSEDKNWSLDNFIKIYAFFKSKNFEVKFLNPTNCQRDIKKIDPKHIIKTYDWSESACLIKKSNILLANDSSISHIGAYLGIYTISLFTKYSARLWFPYPDSIGKPIKLSKNNNLHVVKNVVQEKLTQNSYEIWN